MQYTLNSPVQTKPFYDRSHSYPLTLNSLTKLSTRCCISPAPSPVPVSPTVTHGTPKPIPGSPSTLSTMTLPNASVKDVDLAEL
ncbi:hypothetical protein VKT23_020350, partial [Stygiomarasmius scandens]